MQVRDDGGGVMYVIEVDGVGVDIMMSGRFRCRTHSGTEDQSETTRRLCGGDGRGGAARAEGVTGHEEREHAWGATAAIQ